MWLITFVNGDTEETPEQVDKLSANIEGSYLMGYRRNSYGPDEIIVTYVMANVRKWELIR
jgi:hypothetical protein